MGTTQQNRRGGWVPAIPLPMLLPLGRRQCQHPATAPQRGRVCGRTFWTQDGYRGHYALVHVLELD